MKALASSRRAIHPTRLVAFSALTALAALRYAGTETRPPIARVIALVAVAVAAAGGLTATGGRKRLPRPIAGVTALRLSIVVLLLMVSLLCAGVPADLLAPSGWLTLASHLRAGLDTIAVTLWPYAGASTWARLDIMLALALVTIAAAALGCWPASMDTPTALLRLRIRRLAALALLVALYVVGVLDSDGGSATLEGLVLLGAVAAWLWPVLASGPLRALAAGGWLAACGALAAAVSLGLAGGQPWLDYRAWDLLGAGPRSIAFSWDQTYGPMPWSRSQQTMFTVRGRPPGLWKVTTLDRFDGLRFVRAGAQPPGGHDLPLPLNDRWYEFARFTIVGLRSRLLPAEQGTTVAVTLSSPLDYEPDGTVRTTTGPVPSGETYAVMAYVPRPTPAELRASPRTFPPEYLRYTAFDLPAPGQSGLHVAATHPVHRGRFFTARTVAAPAPGLSPAADRRAVRRILASPYGPMYRLARRLAAGRRSSYDVALAIEGYLKTNYAYSEQTPARRYPLEAFLLTDRIGYCQQFSGAMALMLRMDGIPARVAVGFAGGSERDGLIQVRAVDAHSWVEVYFTGIGWVPFDPTPPRTPAVPQRPLFTSQTAVTAAEAIAATVGGFPRGEAPVGARPRRRLTRPADALLTALVGGALGSLVILALVRMWAIGHLRLRRSLAGDGALAGAELAGALRALGYALPAAPTLAQLERLVLAHGGPDAARYVRALRERRYAPGRFEPPTLSDRRRLRHRLTAHLGLDSRLRGYWALPPAAVRAVHRRAPTL